MIQERAYGKINLGLSIIGKRSDGYHRIDTVFQSIALHDTVYIEAADSFQLTCSQAALACNTSNLAYKAYAALGAYRNKSSAAVHIHLEKRIPLAAGLAGGSADAAAVLRGLNRFWRLGLTAETLCHIGATLGADVPFCVQGGTQRGQGTGEVLTPMAPLPSWPVCILHPPVSVQTGMAYAWFDEQQVHKEVWMEKIVQSVQSADRERLSGCWGNSFESSVFPRVPAAAQCRNILKTYGLVPLLSGSGPTVFAFIPPTIAASSFRRLQQEANTAGIEVYRTHLVRGNGQNDG